MDQAVESNEKPTWCRFTIGGTRFRLPIDAVIELIEPPGKPVAVPGVSQGVLGVFAHRREVIALLDPAAIAGAEPTKAGAAQVLLVRSSRGVVGLPIDASSMTIIRSLDESSDLCGMISGERELELEPAWRTARERITAGYGLV